MEVRFTKEIFKIIICDNVRNLPALASYLVACGISAPRKDHVDSVLNFALDLIKTVERFKDPMGNKIQMSIGISNGPASCGVIGRKKYWFDIWGI